MHYLDSNLDLGSGVPVCNRALYHYAVEEVGTGNQNRMTYGAWNAIYSMSIASWQFLAGVCWAVSRDLGTSDLRIQTGRLKKHFILPGLFCLDE